jgi:hypothetical protein
MDPNWKKRFTAWLGGLTFKQKMKSLERGKTYVCIYCDALVMDKELNESHITTYGECKGSLQHDFAEDGEYIILERGFRGIISAVYYYPPTNPKRAILHYFKENQEMVA